jgi:hypothetical protein
MDSENEVIGKRQPAAPQGVRRFFRFSLRSLFWAITFWSVLVCTCKRLGLVEALEAVTGLTALLILLTWCHREFRVERHRLTALLVILHVLATQLMAAFAYGTTRATESWTWTGVCVWSLAGCLMFPVALVHHFVCRYCGWHSGLAQPGTFFLVVVLNSLLWAYLWRWRQQRQR